MGGRVRLTEAILSKKPFRRKGQEEYVQWFEAGDGPHRDLVTCDYFVSDGVFMTSIDLYAEDILADDYELGN